MLQQLKTFEEQVAILKQHGCVIDDEETCIRVLANVNYYRLSAYFLPLKEKNGCYRKGTTFNQIYQIYEFDRKLRNLLFGALEAIEISLKTRLAYLHGHQYGPLGYLDPKHFNKHHDGDRFINLINSEISRNEKLLFVMHHKEKYDGRFPIWVITELFSFSLIDHVRVPTGDKYHSFSICEAVRQKKSRWNNSRFFSSILTGSSPTR